MFSGNQEILLVHLEQLVDQLNVSIREENINLEETFTTGGLCRIEGKYVLIRNAKATLEEKIQVTVKALKHFNLDDIYVKPIVRELLEKYGDR